MFQNKMKEYTLEQPQEIINEYNEVVTMYVPVGSVKMFIALTSYNDTNSNDMRIAQSTHIGLTSSKLLQEGMLVDGKYEITFIDDTADIQALIYMINRSRKQV